MLYCRQLAHSHNFTHFFFLGRLIVDTQKLLDNPKVREIVAQARQDMHNGRSWSPAVKAIVFGLILAALLFALLSYHLISNQNTQISRILKTFSFAQSSTKESIFFCFAVISFFWLPILFVKLLFSKKLKTIGLAVFIFMVIPFGLDYVFERRIYESGRTDNYLCPAVGDRKAYKSQEPIDIESGRLCLLKTPARAEMFQAVIGGIKTERIPQETVKDLLNVKAFNINGGQVTYRSNNRSADHMYTLYNNPGFDPETGTELQNATQNDINEKIEWLKKQNKETGAFVEVKPTQPVMVASTPQIVQPTPLPLQVQAVPVMENSTIYEKGPNGSIYKTEISQGKVTRSILNADKKVDAEKPVASVTTTVDQSVGVFKFVNRAKGDFREKFVFKANSTEKNKVKLYTDGVYFDGSAVSCGKKYYIAIAEETEQLVCNVKMRFMTSDTIYSIRNAENNDWEVENLSVNNAGVVL